MNPDSPVEGPAGVVPLSQSRLRIKSLMIWIAVLAVGLGWVVQVARNDRILRSDQAVFMSWVADVEKAHAASLITSELSGKSSSNLFEMGRRCDSVFRTQAGKPIQIRADLRIGPLSSVRRVTIETPGRTVTWPFEDIERGRKVDLRAEFPEAFR
jgi:hypothetical protein